jgi:hypothetical protein
MTQPFTQEQINQLYMWFSENPTRRSLDFKDGHRVFAYDMNLQVGKYLTPETDVQPTLESFPEIATENKRKKLEQLKKELGE